MQEHGVQASHVRRMVQTDLRIGGHASQEAVSLGGRAPAGNVRWEGGSGTCFCCSGGAAASMAVVRPPAPSWPGTTAEGAVGVGAGAAACQGTTPPSVAGRSISTAGLGRANCRLHMYRTLYAVDDTGTSCTQQNRFQHASSASLNSSLCTNPNPRTPLGSVGGGAAFTPRHSTVWRRWQGGRPRGAPGRAWGRRGRRWRGRVRRAWARAPA